MLDLTDPMTFLGLLAFALSIPAVIVLLLGGIYIGIHAVASWLTRPPRVPAGAENRSSRTQRPRER